jgi:hypothetical protein
VLLLGSVAGLKARAQSTKLGAPASDPTQATISDSLLLVQGVVRNWLGMHQAGAWVKVGGVGDSTDANGHFQFLLPKRALSQAHYLSATYWQESYGRNRLSARVPFDAARTTPYHIRLRKVINRNPGFF